VFHQVGDNLAAVGRLVGGQDERHADRFGVHLADDARGEPGSRHHVADNRPETRLGSEQAAANDPAKRDLLAKKESLEEKIDTLKYQKAAMDYDDYRKQLSDTLVQLARVQQELDK
jgi:hypothetical protein